jgi:enoyl-CoA hydratase
MSLAEAQIIEVRIEERPGAHVAYVTVNNPVHRNRLGKGGKDQLIAAFTQLAKDDELRVAVLTGAGDKSFISGSDLAEMKDLDAGGQIEVSTKTHLACNAVRCLPVPVIARVNGFCLGSGMELAASCDMRVATVASRFGMPEVKFGIPSGMEACLLPGLVGWGKARELVFTGELMDAHEAYRCGFVDRLVTPGEIDEAVEKWVSSICAAGPRAIRLQKALVQDWERMSIKDAVQRGIAAMGESRSTDEPVRLMQAFVDRKKGLQ